MYALCLCAEQFPAASERIYTKHIFSRFQFDVLRWLFPRAGRADKQLFIANHRRGVSRKETEGNISKDMKAEKTNYYSSTATAGIEHTQFPVLFHSSVSMRLPAQRRSSLNTNE